MDTKLSLEEIINWIATCLKDGKLEAKVLRDAAGNITYIYTVPTAPIEDDPRRTHRKDPRRTKPL